MIEPSDQQIIKAAREHGARIGNNPQAGSWMLLDGFNQPDFSHGMFVSEAACARAYCEHHDIMPTVPDVQPPPAELRIAKPPGVNLRAVVVTVLLVAITVAVIA